jgi:hypothetical protein
MKEPEDAGKYQVNNKIVQGQVIGDNPIVHQHFYTTKDKATSSTKPEHVRNVSATSSLSSKQRQNRERLLKRVRAIWIEGLLEQSLHRAAWIDLHLQEQPDALENPWRLEVQELDQAPRPLPIGTSIVEVYDKADGELLILGEPGAGKTTLLLHLAQALLDRAESDEYLPIPVVFNLSSWAKLRRPFAQWLVEELKSKKYRIPQKVAQQWVEMNQILPLLDGLDEVAEEARIACIQAITAYCSQHPSQTKTSLVVCCRSEEYQALPLHLLLDQAVSILPLTDAQIETYLSGTRGQLEELRQMLHDDTDLYEMGRRPLFLNIFALAYQRIDRADLSPELTPERKQRAVFDSYVQSMLLRRRKQQRGTREQFLRWLHFLAKHMYERQETFVNPEPDWLSGPSQRLYWRYVRLFIGLAVGLLAGLFSSLLFGLLEGLLFGLVAGVVEGLFFGLLAGLTIKRSEKIPFYGPRRGRPPVEATKWSWKRDGLCGVFWGVNFEKLFELLTRLTARQTPGSHFGLVAGLFAGLVTMVLFGLPPTLVLGLNFWLESEPNLIFLGGLFGLGLWIFLGLPISLFFGLLAWLTNKLVVVLLALLFVCLYMRLFSTIIDDIELNSLTQYYILRFWLWRSNSLPWDLNKFLDEATERLLVRKEGNSYTFWHRLLLDYFAKLDEPATTENTSSVDNATS